MKHFQGPETDVGPTCIGKEDRKETCKKLLAWQGHKFRQIDYVNLCCMSRDGDLMLPHLLHVQWPSSSLDHGFKLPLRQCSRWNSSKGHH